MKEYPNPNPTTEYPNERGYHLRLYAIVKILKGR
jgi:hypothetical protein